MIYILIFGNFEFLKKASTKGYGENCTTIEGMYMNVSCSTALNLYCPSTGNSSGVCSCQPYYYYASSTLGCVSKTSYLVACTSSSSCRSDLGLYCISGVCQCQTYYYWSYASLMCSKLIKRTL